MNTTTLEFKNLTKVYPGSNTIAVDNLTAAVAGGKVTGFLGPNGAGKSTSLRCLLNLVTPTLGSATISGVNYRELVDPVRTVGALLDSRGFHPGLTAKQNLAIIAAAAKIPLSRISEVIELVDLAGAANLRTKGFSLGMKQRLSLAIAFLGDPEVLVLDEPANGLDPQGIVWLRSLLKKLASEGRTILVSSHQLSEMQNTVDDVIILNQGKLVVADSITEICAGRTLEEAFLELTGATEY